VSNILYITIPKVNAMLSEKEKIIIQAIKFMKKHLNEEITSESLAYHVGYSPFHFSRVFKEVTGVSPRHYLSALRIEAGKQTLVNSSDSILKTLLGVGFRSIGTFSSKFKQFVGLSPKAFQKNIEYLHSFVNDYDFSKELYSLEPLAPSVTCHVIAPPSFKGIIYVGLFPRPIPDQVPIVGYALNHHKTSCTFSKVPKGEYYILATAVQRSLNPRHYFLLDNALRGKADEPINLKENTNIYAEVTLREPLPFDPPILINLPKVLFDTQKRKQEEK
jgi:AraC family transcriptional regulator